MLGSDGKPFDFSKEFADVMPLDLSSYTPEERAVEIARIEDICARELPINFVLQNVIEADIEKITISACSYTLEHGKDRRGQPTDKIPFTDISIIVRFKSKEAAARHKVAKDAPLEYLSCYEEVHGPLKPSS